MISLIVLGVNGDDNEGFWTAFMTSLPSNKLTAHNVMMLRLALILVGLNIGAWTSLALSGFPTPPDCRALLFVTIAVVVIIMMVESYRKYFYSNRK